ncbi:MAG: hypothetical protein Ct9H300mP1_11640 [Planctomycetaceae bacterium]|nr:MAG: hypothetical protein Ct9H300mP1_11640 [Planctomycetaceae bacterium]
MHLGRADPGRAVPVEIFPRAIHGDAKTLNSLKPRPKVPLQIIPTVHKDRIEMVVLADGKPLPGALFTTVDDDLVNEELKADKNGRVVFRPDTEGHFCVYTKRVTPGKGTHGGKKYTETRDFATLAFQWPLISSGGDKEAITLFENPSGQAGQLGQVPRIHRGGRRTCRRPSVRRRREGGRRRRRVTGHRRKSTPSNGSRTSWDPWHSTAGLRPRSDRDRCCDSPTRMTSTRWDDC